MPQQVALVPLERVERRILNIRGQRVILDADLATLYGVTTKRLNEQVKRNQERFPKDFVFRLKSRELAEVVANCDHLGKLRFSHVRPLAFTEHGAIMAANVINSHQAVEASVHVVRAFVRLRQWMGAQVKLTAKLAELEQRIGSHDAAINEILGAIHALMNPPPDRRRKQIGFHVRP